MSPVCLVRNKKCLFLAVGILFYNSSTCSFMIFKMKPGKILKFSIKFLNGTWMVALQRQFLLGNILFLEEVVEHSSKAAIEQEVSMLMIHGTLTLTIKIGYL